MADLPEWAMEKAREVFSEAAANAFRPPSMQEIALALVEAERRGIERAAEVADTVVIARGNAPGKVIARNLAAAIRKLGDER